MREQKTLREMADNLGIDRHSGLDEIINDLDINKDDIRTKLETIYPFCSDNSLFPSLPDDERYDGSFKLNIPT